jgi:hypothetical protein
MGVIALVVQHSKGHQHVSNRRGVEAVVEGEHVCAIAVGHLNSHGPHSKGRELLLICSFELKGWLKGRIRNEVCSVQGDTVCRIMPESYNLMQMLDSVSTGVMAVTMCSRGCAYTSELIFRLGR